jgi:hypothetical protein
MAEWRTRKTITQDEMLFILHLHPELMTRPETRGWNRSLMSRCPLKDDI